CFRVGSGQQCAKRRHMRRSKKAPAIRSRHQRSRAAWGGTVRPSALRPARICDDRYHANLVQTAPLLHACKILGKGRMWLTAQLVPDHKTIGDFRKDTGAAICKFIMLSWAPDLSPTRQGRGRRDGG